MNTNMLLKNRKGGRKGKRVEGRRRKREGKGEKRMEGEKEGRKKAGRQGREDHTAGEGWYLQGSPGGTRRGGVVPAGISRRNTAVGNVCSIGCVWKPDSRGLLNQEWVSGG